MEVLVKKLDNLNHLQSLTTLTDYNDAVDVGVVFDSTILDGKATIGLNLNKTNWAQKLVPPLLSYFL